MEKEIYEEGGYPALWKYKIGRLYLAIQEGECCCGKN
jgi:hypothetical protein